MATCAGVSTAGSMHLGYVVGLQPGCTGLQPGRTGLQPGCTGLQPGCTGVAAVRGAGRGQQRTCTRRHGRRGAARAAVRRSARGPSATAPRRLACSMGGGDAVRVGHVYMCARVHRVCVRACARARARACAWCMGAACFDGDAEGREARGAHHVELLVRERHPVRSAAPGLGLGLGLANPYPTLT